MSPLEREIDALVYALYDLTADEIAQVETAQANTRGQSSDDEDSDSE